MLFQPAWWQRRLALASIFILLGLAPSAEGSTPMGLSLDTLVNESEATLLGHTLSLRSFWQGPRIVTVTKVAVDELWAGSVRGHSTVDVITLGGQVGEYGQRVDGAGELPNYGRVVLHVSPVSAEEWAPLGMAEGIWHVEGLWGDGSRVRRDTPNPARAGFARPWTLWGAKPCDTVGSLRQAVAQAHALSGTP